MAIAFHSRAWLALALLILAGFFLPPLINMNRFHARIVRSMENALGRRVDVESVSLRLLPQPGFDLYRLTIADDPAFGAEPMLRADEVTAVFRWRSLWRGRLELASLSLNSGANGNPPSLNLVRTQDGRWNLGTLLLRTQQMPSAPTPKTRVDSRPHFPYIEAAGGRINFKFGAEKKAYALTDADFALWQDSENEWAFRLSARPVRTNSGFNLGDAGALRMKGQFRRASSLFDTPVDVELGIQGAPLGALSNLLYGRDRGWRGTLSAHTRVTGTPTDLQIASQISLEDFRRYDIFGAESAALRLQCGARYSAPVDAFSAINCNAPLSNGLLLIDGNMEGSLEPTKFHFDLDAKGIGVQSLVNLARRMKKDLPQDLFARGTADFTFQVDCTNGGRLWAGGGHTSEIELSSSVLKSPLVLPRLEFTAERSSAEPASPATRRRFSSGGRKGFHASAQIAPSGEWGLEFKRFELPLGGAAPVEVSARFNPNNYRLGVDGAAEIHRLLQAGRVLGFSVPQYTVGGSAHLELLISGGWAGFSAPQISGVAQLRDVRVPVRGLNAPLVMAAGELQLTGGSATLQHASLSFAPLPLEATLTATVPRNCFAVEQCGATFDMQAGRVSMDELNRLLNPRFRKSPWYDFFGNPVQASPLLRLRANGRLHADEVDIKTLAARHVSAAVTVDQGMISLNGLDADVLGGKHSGNWQANFTGAEPQYEGKGDVSGLSLPQLALVMHDAWGDGKARIGYAASLSGSGGGQLLSSLEAHGNFEWQEGTLRHLRIDNYSTSAPLKFRRFAGELAWRNGELSLAHGEMTVEGGNYETSGTASATRQLNFKLLDNRSLQEYAVTGSLDAPKVVPVHIKEDARAAIPAAARTTVQP